MQASSSGPGVALLFQDTELGAHLRQALVDAGARIVHEGPATSATRDDLSGNDTDVIVINLDATVEDHLDTLYDMFDEDRQRIVFNDAEVSSGLSGWDQARWARHLAAKLLDGQDVDPPRPGQARGIEINPTELELPEAEVPAAPPEPASVPALETQQDKGFSEQDSADLTAELEALLAEDGDLLDRSDAAEESEFATDLQAVDIELDDVDMPEPEPEAEPNSESEGVIDSGASGPVPDPVLTNAADLDLPDDTDIEAVAEEPAGPDDLDMALEDASASMDSNAAISTESRDSGADDDVPKPSSGDTSDDSGLLDFGDVPELTDLEIASSEEAAQDNPDGEPELSLEAFPVMPTDADGSDGKPVWTDASNAVQEPASGESGPETTQDSAQPPSAPDWELVDFDAEPDAADVRVQNTADETADASAFGIEKVSASEYLAPESDGDASGTEPTLSLELEPIAQAVAPKMIDAAAYEMSLDSGASNNIRHVVVVGVGAEDEARATLQAFLESLQSAPDAAFLGVVHQTGDDLAELARSLDSACPLNVRVAENPARVRHGDMLLVPAGKQATLGYNGRVQLLDAAEQPMVNPSIDLTLTQVAQEMGANVLAVILAGDAIDALAGAQAVSDRGGHIWTLDPADCTANTMVAVICEEQLAEFTGTPQTLAARLLEELS